MKRLVLIGLTMATVGAGAGVMRLKYEVSQRVDRLEGVARQIASDKQTIRVLEAELAHLTTPERLEMRQGQHLALMPPRPDQIIRSPRNIPLRLVPASSTSAVQQKGPSKNSQGSSGKSGGADD